MAQPRTWLPRWEEIVAILRKMKSKHLDRSAIEELFQLQRRAAIELIKQAGASGERGAPLLVERTSLLSWVERTAQDEMWQLSRSRKLFDDLSQSTREIQAIRAAFKDKGKEPVTFPVVEVALKAAIQDLPENISITAGKIIIILDDLDAGMQALQLLYELGLAINNDYDEFADRVGNCPTASKPLGEQIRGLVT